MTTLPAMFAAIPTRRQFLHAPTMFGHRCRRGWAIVSWLGTIAFSLWFSLVTVGLPTPASSKSSCAARLNDKSCGCAASKRAAGMCCCSRGKSPAPCCSKELRVPASDAPTPGTGGAMIAGCGCGQDSLPGLMRSYEPRIAPVAVDGPTEDLGALSFLTYDERVDAWCVVPPVPPPRSTPA